MDGGRRFDDPDERIAFGGVVVELLTIGGLTVSRSVQPAGWRWRDDFQPLVGGDRCMARHVGIVLSGRQAIQTREGLEYELGPGDLYDVDPGHDGWTLGDEDCVMLEWSGQRQWIGSGEHRIVATVLFTDIVGSTQAAAAMGDAAWHDLLSVHYYAGGEAVTQFSGRAVTTTGDGLLAVFESPGNAVRCARTLHRLAERQRISIRIGVHTGEIEVANDDVRGVTIHEAARVMAAAGPGETLVSQAAVMLSRSSDLTFEDAGEHELKGVPDRWRLFRVTS